MKKYELNNILLHLTGPHRVIEYNLFTEESDLNQKVCKRTWETLSGFRAFHPDKYLLKDSVRKYIEKGNI